MTSSLVLNDGLVSSPRARVRARPAMTLLPRVDPAAGEPVQRALGVVQVGEPAPDSVGQDPGQPAGQEHPGRADPAHPGDHAAPG
jgi:hypothetical protein